MKCSSARWVIADLSQSRSCHDNIPMFKVIITTIGVLALGLILATGVAVHYSAQQATVRRDASGWNTYRNEEFGFEIKYPPEDFTIMAR